jgi:hypothetical protein
MEIGMKQIACRYAIIQFMPYSETSEFANIGVVLVCPETGQFEFKLKNKRYARITAFFNELNANIYLASVGAIQKELERIQRITMGLPASTERAAQVRTLLEALTHPREAMIRFSLVRPILTRDVGALVAKLFDHYVERDFATPEYVELNITRRIQTLLSEIPLPAPFKSERIGDEQIHASFPLVQRLNDKVSKIIKPFNLAQDEANKIFDHGDSWLQKVRRLRKRDLLPREVLFAIASPPESDVKRFGAYREICIELEQADIIVVGKGHESRILEFATGTN